MKRISPAPILLAVAALLLALPSAAAPVYNLGGASGTLTSSSGNWAWDGNYLAGFRNALEDPANFGDTGIATHVQFQTQDLTTINATTLSGLDGFVSSWWRDNQAGPYVADVVNFFLGGGDLYLLQDDSNHDAIGAALGFATTASDGSPSNGVAEFFNGAFGSASNIVQGGNTGQIDGAAVLAAGGTIGATNASGQVTIAYWAEGAFAPGSGSLYIMADVDMWATTPFWPSASYAPLNGNGTVALNVLARLPEPDLALLLLPGLLGLTLAGSPRKAE